MKTFNFGNFLFKYQALFLVIFMTFLSQSSMAQSESDLINAVVGGDIDAVYDSLGNGVDVDSKK